MKTFFGPLMTSFVTVDRVRVEDSVIKDILEKQPVVPVTINYNAQAIGVAKEFYIRDNMLHTVVTVDELRIPVPTEQVYVVPGLSNVQFHYEGKTRVITAADLDEVSLSLLPADPNLTPIKLKGE